MQIDCHYYGTYYVARKAGWSHDEAKKIAWAAQTVDEMDHVQVAKLINRELLLNGDGDVKKIIKDDYSLVTVTTVLYLAWLSTIALTDNDNDRARLLVKYAWVPFHFLPIGENELEECRFERKTCKEVADSANYLGAIINYRTFASVFDSLAVPRNAIKTWNLPKYRRNTEEDIFLICQTSTELCRRMILNAKEYYQNHKVDEKGLYRIGICMHVLADTWSHQGFCGSNNMFINHVNLLDDGGTYYKDGGTIGLGTVLDTEIPLSPAWTGHGSASNNPDIPGCKYKMEYNFLNTSVPVDNKERFKNAFSQMYSALKYIKNDEIDKESSFDFNKYEIPVDEMNVIKKNFTVDEDMLMRVKKWKESIKNNIEEHPVIEYRLECGEKIPLFMHAAREHRNSIMKQISYYDFEGKKICYDSYRSNVDGWFEDDMLFLAFFYYDLIQAGKTLDEAEMYLKEKIKELRMIVYGVQEMVAKKMDDIQKKIEAKVDEIKKIVEGKANDAKKIVEQKIEEMKKMVAETFEPVRENLGIKFNEFKGFVDSTVKPIQVYLQNEMERIKNVLESKVEPVFEYLKKKIDEIKKVVDDAVKSAQEYLGKFADEAKEMAGEAVKPVKNVANNVEEKWNAGLLKFFDGIFSNWDLWNLIR